MTIISWIGLINLVLTLGIALFVLLKAKKTNPEILFFVLFCFAIALYNYGYFYWGIAKNVSDGMRSYQILLGGIILINSMFLHFVISLTSQKNKYIIYLIINDVVCFIFLILNFKLILFDVVSYFRWGYWPSAKENPLFFLYIVFWALQAVIGLSLLCIYVIKKSGEKALQIKYIFFATLIGYIGGGSNWLPAFDIYFPPYSNILISFYVAIMAYVIVRHRALGVNYYLKRTIVFSLIFSLFLYLLFIAINTNFHKITIYALLPLISSFISLGLGIYVLINRKDKIGEYFSCICFVTFFWQFTWGVLIPLDNPILIIYIIKAGYVFIILIPYYFYRFFSEYSGSRLDIVISRQLIIIPAVFILLLITTKGFIKGYYEQLWGVYPQCGIFHLLFIVYVVVMFLRCLYLITTKTIRERIDCRLRNQNYYLLIALVFYFLSSSDFLVNYGYSFYPIGFVFVVMFLALIFYAILRYQLMNIAIFIKKTLVFTSIFFLTVTLIWFSSFKFADIVRFYSFENVKGMPIILSILIILVIYEPVRNLLVHVTDRFLFQRKYDFGQLLSNVSHLISRVRNLNDLSRQLVTVFTLGTRIDNATFLFRSKTKQSFVVSAVRGKGSAFSKLELFHSHSVIKYFLERRLPIRFRDVFQEDKKKHYEDYNYHEIMLLMEELKADLLLPCMRVDESGKIILNSIIALGKKKSDEDYSADEVSTLFTLSHGVAVAVENAVLLDEVLEKTEDLEKNHIKLEEFNSKIKEKQAQIIIAEKTNTMVNMAKAMGHEINNPLAIARARISGILQEDLREIRNSLSSSPNGLREEPLRVFKEKLGGIEDLCMRMDRSGNQIELAVKILTDLMKSSKGGLEPISFGSVWNESLKTSRFSMYDETLGNCQFSATIPSDAMVMGNMGNMVQVFNNLIKNSYEAMREQKNKRISVSAKEDNKNGYLEIRFLDNGKGIPVELRHQIWQKDFTTKQVDVGESGLLGQGLYVCRHIVETIHKGKISLDEDLNEGACFIICLPLGKRYEI